MRNLLVIGKTGQLGTALCKDAPRFGFEVFAWGRDELDVTKEEQVKEKFVFCRPDVVINTSAYHVTQDCEKNPQLAMAVNYYAVGRLAEYCHEFGARFVTFSTYSVFDGASSVPYEEEDAVHPLQMYGISKAAGEYAARHLYPEGSYVIRTGSLYGGGRKGSSAKGSNFVLGILRQMRNNERIEVSSEQVANLTSANDLSDATLRLIVSDGRAGIYHLINEGYGRFCDFAEEIGRIIGWKGAIEPVDRGGMEGTMRRPKFGALANIKARDAGVILPDWQTSLKTYVREVA